MSTFVNLLDVVYPIGSVVLRSDDQSPAELVGGTWVQVSEGTFVCAGEVSLLTGGSNSHSLSIEEIPGMYWHTDSISRDTIKVSFDKGSVYGINAAPSSKTGDAFDIMPQHITFCVWYRTS